MKIKICGVKTLEIAQAVVDAGATHIGFVFFGKSPRNISPREAAKIAEKIKGKIETVIVTVNPSDELIAETLTYFTPDYIQLHGIETPDRIKEIKTKFDLQVIKAIPISTKKDLLAVEKFKKLADYILFDAKATAPTDMPGGNSRFFDWDIIKDLKADYKWILSGGLNAGNVKEAIKATNAEFVDVSSGVESAPGDKQASMIRSFINNAN